MLIKTFDKKLKIRSKIDKKCGEGMNKIAFVVFIKFNVKECISNEYFRQPLHFYKNWHKLLANLLFSFPQINFIFILNNLLKNINI